jgi:hypothetical protein
MYIPIMYFVFATALLVIVLLGIVVWFGRKLDGIHALVNSRLSDMIEHVVAAGKAEAVLAALQARLQGIEEGKAQVRSHL